MLHIEYIVFDEQHSSRSSDTAYLDEHLKRIMTMTEDFVVRDADELQDVLVYTVTHFG